MILIGRNFFFKLYQLCFFLQIIAHELGHNLGMKHDFVDPFTYPKPIRRDSAGNTCTDVNSVMDYFVIVKQWSTCSVEDLTIYYNNVLQTQGSFCMPVNSAPGLHYFFVRQQFQM